MFVFQNIDLKRDIAYAASSYGKQFFGQIGRSDWLIFGRDFTVRAITMETVRLRIFLVRFREI